MEPIWKNWENLQERLAQAAQRADRDPRDITVVAVTKTRTPAEIEAALGSSYIRKIIVSTDDEEIAEISRKFGAEVPVFRPKHLATKKMFMLLPLNLNISPRGLEYKF
mgnify:CR=1 FL=1